MTVPIDPGHRWSPVEIAAGATCLAAIVAGVASFVVAVVNIWSARRIARETARREFRLSGVREYLDFLDQRIVFYHEMRNAGPRLAEKLAAVPEPFLTSGLDVAIRGLAMSQGLDEIASRVGAAQPFYLKPGVVAAALSDQKVQDALFKAIAKDRAFQETFVASGGVANATENQRRLGECASQAFFAVVKSRLAIEEFVFGHRGWLRRGCYFMWSLLRKALR
jgi:hypothetical protein